jgi:protein subunit release factor A
MVFRILCRRQHPKCLTKLIARHCSTTQNENVIVAKSLMDHIDSMTESNSSQYFHLRKLKEKVAHLHDEFIELSAIDPSDELATIAQEECSANSVKIRKLLKESGRFLISLNKYDTQDAYLEVTAGAGGLEAGVFAGEILNLYLGYIRHLGFEYSIEEQEEMQVSKLFPNSMARAKVSVHGCDVFHSLKYECGVHRVQRFPYTGKKKTILQIEFVVLLLFLPSSALLYQILTNTEYVIAECV